MTFNSSGLLAQDADRYGNGVVISRTGNTMTVSDLHDSTRYIEFFFNSDSPVPHVTSISDFTGRTWLYAYDSSHRLISVTAPISSTDPVVTTQYSYYTDTALGDLLQSVTDADGNVTQYAYYANRRGFQVTDADGDFDNLSFNIFRSRSDYTDDRGLTTYFTCDASGDVVQQLNPDGTTTASTWQNNLKMSDTDAFGQTTTYYYNANGNLVEAADPLENVAYTKYTNISLSNGATLSAPLQTTKLGRPSSGDTVAGFGTLLNYTPTQLGSQTGTATAQNGNSSLLLTGNVAKAVACSYTIDANTVLAFDFSSTTPAGQASGEIQAIGFNPDLTTWTPANLFQLAGTDTTTLARQDFNSYAVATTGGVRHYVIPIGQYFTGTVTLPYLVFVNETTSSSTSLFSNIHVYEAVASATSYAYSNDLTGSLTSITDADGDVTSYTYPTPNRGLPRSTTSPKGNVSGHPYGYGTTWYEYNSAGQVTAQYTPVPTTNSTVPTSYSHTGYIEQSFVYDTPTTQGRGLLTSSTDGNGASPGDPAHTTTYTYDPLGDRTSQTQPDPDGAGRCPPR